MNKVFLLDFENVHDDGLTAISENIGKNDIVFVFFTVNAKKVEFSSIVRLVNENKMHIVEAHPGSQSLDMTLASYLGYLITKYNKNDTEFVIVSNDKDYNNIIELWKNHGYKISARKLKKKQAKKEENNTTDVAPAKATRQTAEEKNELNKKLSQALSNGKVDNALVGKTTKFVLKCVDDGQGKNYIYNNMRKEFGNDKGHELYNLIKKLL